MCEPRRKAKSPTPYVTEPTEAKRAESYEATARRTYAHEAEQAHATTNLTVNKAINQTHYVQILYVRTEHTTTQSKHKQISVSLRPATTKPTRTGEEGTHGTRSGANNTANQGRKVRMGIRSGEWVREMKTSGK